MDHKSFVSIPIAVCLVIFLVSLFLFSSTHAQSKVTYSTYCKRKYSNRGSFKLKDGRTVSSCLAPGPTGTALGYVSFDDGRPYPGDTDDCEYCAEIDRQAAAARAALPSVGVYLDEIGLTAYVVGPTGLFYSTTVIKPIQSIDLSSTTTPIATR